MIIDYKPKLRSSFIIKSSIITVLVALAASNPSFAADTPFSSKQKEEINKVIKQYIYDHPEIIVDAISRMQSRQKAEEEARVISALKKNRQKLEKTPDDPIIGNPNAPVTVVEFFDYRCGYCKRVFKNMIKVLEGNSNVRFVLKELPILGPGSLAASRASLAVWKLNKEKYFAFHSALLEARGSMTDTKIFHIADKLGINTTRLKSHITSPEIDKILQENQRLAQDLNITGTPAFVIGDKLIPGALDLDTMRQVIAAENQTTLQ